jgi:hypothetical protein
MRAATVHCIFQLASRTIALLFLYTAIFVRPAQGDDLVVLAPLIVEASSSDPWMYYKIDDFEVLSRCPKEFTENFVRHLQNSRIVREAILPADFFARPAPKVKFVLDIKKPNAPDGAQWDKRIRTEIVTASSRHVPTATSTTEFAKPALVSDGETYLSYGNYWYIVKELANVSIDPDTEILLRRRLPSFPEWFLIGATGDMGALAQRAVQIASDGTLHVRIPTKNSRATGIGLAHQRPSLAELFEGGKTTDRPTWEEQAALFVRWGLFAQDEKGGNYRDKFLEFVRRGAIEPAREDLFRRCFGFSYESAELLLETYRQQTSGAEITLSVPEDRRPLPSPTFATSEQEARIIGDWARLAAKRVSTGPLNLQADDTFRDLCLARAERLFQRAVGRDGWRIPELLAAYGLYKLQLNEIGLARHALDIATAQKTERSEAYVALAGILLDRGEGLGEDRSNLFQLLQAARDRLPSNRRIYTTLIRLVRISGTITESELAMLTEATRLLRFDSALVTDAVRALQWVHRPEAAEKLLAQARPFLTRDQAPPALR